MATVSFSMPTGPVVYARRKTGGFFNILFAIVILVGVGAFIWYFYKSMMSMTPASPAPAPTSCTVSGKQSTTNDGSDCCTGSMDFNNVCQPPNSSVAPATAPACVPDGTPSLTNGNDCCAANGVDDDGNCMPTTPTGSTPTSSVGAPASS